MSVVVVAGTDTGVGKTWVTRALARALATAGHRVLAIKPVETGFSGPVSADEDGALLAAATGQASPTAALYRLATPVAPAAAADLEGVTIDFDGVVGEIRSRAAGADVVLVEGAGGVLSPVTWEWNIVDLARALSAPALLVGSDRLGSMNHTLLALSALDCAGVEVCGVALTAPPEPDRSTGDNAAAIARLAKVDRIVTLPRRSDPLAAGESVVEILRWVQGRARSLRGA